MRLLTAAVCLLAAACSTAPEYFTLPERASLNLPYSDAVRIGDLLFLSGTVGVAPGTRQLVEGGVTAEARQALENVKANLAARGLSMDDAVKCTVLLADIRDFDAMNAVYREYFPRNKPARTTFGVGGLPLGARIEVDCIAAFRAR